MGNELLEILAALEAANKALTDAVREGDVEQRKSAYNDVLALQRVRDAELRADSAAHRRANELTLSVPLRDHVIQLASVISRPVPTRLLGELSRAMLSSAITSSQIASLRRDEMRSWDKAQDASMRTTLRETYAVSALHADRLSPVRATIALSHWPLELRLMGPLSPRVDFLHAAKAVAHRAITVRDTPSDASMNRLAARLGRAVPGTPAVQCTPEIVIERANAELERVEPEDRDDRAAAAARALKQVDERTSIFGAEVRLVSAEGRAAP